jgi:predicted Rossmann fold nucleotide-binding protein DprA/Smf involved in DNA uptake
MASGAFQQVWAIGNVPILQTPLLGFFCSMRCPGEIILRTYDLAQALRAASIPVISGFHTPMEKECLALLLHGQQPVVLCPARSIAHMRLPTDWQRPLAEDRLLVLSPFEAKHRRPTVELAAQRNRFVAALAEPIFVAYAAPRSKTEALCMEVLQQGRRVFTLGHAANARLLTAGAHPATISSLRAAVSGHA